MVALGGGSVLSDEIRAALDGHVVVWLDVDAETAWGRVEGRRPLARAREPFEALHAERLDVYEALADAIVPGDDDAPARALPALLALRELPRATRMLVGAKRLRRVPGVRRRAACSNPASGRSRAAAS